MKKINIVFSFRDRDLDRVKNCLDSLDKQTCKNFYVTIVDYGSKYRTSMSLVKIINKYKFTNYIYTNTIGMAWNKSQALNIAIKNTKSHSILIGDIDLIYSKNFIKNIININLNTHFLSIPIFYLPNKFSLHDSVNLSKLKISHAPNGAVLFASTTKFKELNGFDEFYSFWGVEDRDMISRLENIGLKPMILDHNMTPIFHQWHQSFTDQKNFFMPNNWWDQMNIYYQLNKKNVFRNNNNIGKVYHISDRPILYSPCKKIDIKNRGSSYDKGKVICELIDRIQQNNHKIAFEIDKISPSLYSFFKRKIKDVIYFYRNKSNSTYYIDQDIFSVIWDLIQKKVIIDYYIEYKDDRMSIKIL